jgi:hypothetical protein
MGQYTAQHGNDQKQISGHENLYLFNFRDDLPEWGSVSTLTNGSLHSGVRKPPGQLESIHDANKSFHLKETALKLKLLIGISGESTGFQTPWMKAR